MDNQAVQEASLYTPLVILHQIDTDLTWTIFRFTDAGATKEITIEVDTPQSGVFQVVSLPPGETVTRVTPQS